MSSEPDDDATKARSAEDTLPSIIVDPGLLADSNPPAAPAAVEPVVAVAVKAATASEPVATSTPATPTTSAEVAAAAPSERPLALDAAADALLLPHDADRFAASIRPSWEPPAPVDGAPVRGTVPPTFVAAEVAPSDEEPLPTAPVAVRTSKTAALLLTVALVFAFGALLVYAVAGGETERPESWSGGAPPAPAPAAAPAAAVPPSEAAHAPAPIAAPVPTAPPPPIEAPTEPAPTAPPPTPAAEAAVAPPAAPPAPAVEAAPRTVRVHVETIPRGAELRLDGVRVSNPLDTKLAKGRHRIEARAAGFVTQSRPLIVDRSQSLELRLVRAEAAPTTTTKSPKTSKPPTAPRPEKKPAAGTGAGFVEDSPY